jgi:acyl-CoA thioester hydrolase
MLRCFNIDVVLFKYYSYFDTVINHFLIHQGKLNPTSSSTIGLCVESSCSYFSPLEFPNIIEAGLVVTHKGKTSIKYEIGIFQQGQAQSAARGHFVHVFVDSKTRKPTPYNTEISIAINHILAEET